MLNRHAAVRSKSLQGYNHTNAPSPRSLDSPSRSRRVWLDLPSADETPQRPNKQATRSEVRFRHSAYAPTQTSRGALIRRARRVPAQENTGRLANGEPSWRRVCTTPFCRENTYRVWATAYARNAPTHSPYECRGTSLERTETRRVCQCQRGARFSKNASMPSRASSSDALRIMTSFV